MLRFVFKHLLTGKDNETYDIARVAIACVVLLFPVMVFWGMIMLTWAWIIKEPFDLQTAYTALSTILLAFGTFMLSGAGSLLLKQKTEPDARTKENANEQPINE